MKKVNLTLSRLAALSAVGAFCFAGDCDGDANKNGNTTTTTTPSTPAAGLNEAQVKKLIADNAPAAGEITAVKLAKLMEEAAVKGIITTAVADHAELKAWVAAKGDVSLLTAQNSVAFPCW